MGSDSKLLLGNIRLDMTTFGGKVAARGFESLDIASRYLVETFA